MKKTIFQLRVDVPRLTPYARHSPNWRNAISTSRFQQATFMRPTGKSSRDCVDPPTPGKDPTCFQGGSNGERTNHLGARMAKNVDRVVNVLGFLQFSKGKSQTFIRLCFLDSALWICCSYRCYGGCPSKYGLFAFRDAIQSSRAN